MYKSQSITKNSKSSKHCLLYRGIVLIWMVWCTRVGGAQSYAYNPTRKVIFSNFFTYNNWRQPDETSTQTWTHNNKPSPSWWWSHQSLQKHGFNESQAPKGPVAFCILFPRPPLSGFTRSIKSMRYQQLYHYKGSVGSGRNEKILPCRFPKVGIVQQFHQQKTLLPPQTSSRWCAICPSYNVGSMEPPNPMWVTTSSQRGLMRTLRLGLI
jgi:hypothetical protein